jgi:hypothetical protein
MRYALSKPSQGDMSARKSRQIGRLPAFILRQKQSLKQRKLSDSNSARSISFFLTNLFIIGFDRRVFKNQPAARDTPREVSGFKTILPVLV